MKVCNRCRAISWFRREGINVFLDLAFTGRSLPGTKEILLKHDTICVQYSTFLCYVTGVCCIMKSNSPITGWSFDPGIVNNFFSSSLTLFVMSRHLNHDLRRYCNISSGTLNRELDQMFACSQSVIPMAR